MAETRNHPPRPAYYCRNLYHPSTLASSIADSFAYLAPQYGLRVDGIEDDVNEWGDFWLAVAKNILAIGEANVG